MCSTANEPVTAEHQRFSLLRHDSRTPGKVKTIFRQRVWVKASASAAILSQSILAITTLRPGRLPETVRIGLCSGTGTRLIPLQPIPRLLSDLRERRRIRGVETGRMAEAARADPDPAHRGGVHDIVDDIVGTIGVPAHAADAGPEVIQAEIVAHAPGDHVVGARGVAAHAETADDFVRGADLGVEAEAPAEHVHAADAFPDNNSFLNPGGVLRVYVAEKKDEAAPTAPAASA